MRLAEAGRPADEQRVVGEAGQLGDGERGGVREAVAVADDELVEREARVELSAGQVGRRARLRRGLRRRVDRGPGSGRPLRLPARRSPAGATSETSVPAPSTASAHAWSTREKRPLTHGRILSGASTTSVPRIELASRQRLEPDVPGRVSDGVAQLPLDAPPGVWEIVVEHEGAGRPPPEGEVGRSWSAEGP